MSDESIKPPSTSDKMLNPSVNYVGTKARVEIKWDCLKQENIPFDHGKLVNIYIVYEINKTFNSSICPTLENCLIGTVKLTKHVDVDLCKYSGYGIRFDWKRFYLLGNKVGRNAIIFWLD